MNRCPDLVVCLKRDLQCLRPEASLVLIYRPNVAGMKGRVDLAQPVKRTPDLWCGSTIYYHSILFDLTVIPSPELFTSLSPVPLKTHRVGQRCTLNLSRAETSSRWCGVVARRGGASSGVVHVT
ncbi:hypothetical protein TNCV_2473031 [Trichonephila clavipes]|nr:hypothetical protein TNCV_2473031 [Trichonephila clavipes]